MGPIKNKDLKKSLEQIRKTADRITNHLNQFQIEYRTYCELRQSRIEQERK